MRLPFYGRGLRQKIQGRAKKNPAKFGDTCSIRADELCIGCLGQWVERGRENLNMQELFGTTLYSKCTWDGAFEKWRNGSAWCGTAAKADMYHDWADCDEGCQTQSKWKYRDTDVHSYRGRINGLYMVW